METVSSLTTSTEPYLLRDFLNYITVEKGLSENTIAAYQQDLARYLAFFKSRKIRDWSHVTRDHILQFLVAEKARGLEAPSIARRLVARNCPLGRLRLYCGPFAVKDKSRGC